MSVVCGLEEVCEVRDGVYVCVCVWIVELVSRLEEGAVLLIRHR